MLPTRLSLLFLSFIAHSSIAQIQVGYYHDLDGRPIHDYVDPFQYSPTKKLRVTHYSSSFEKGKVYFKNGDIVEGFIQYENKKIWYKERRSDKKTKLKPAETMGLRIGLDSFFVASNFNVEQRVGPNAQTQPQFMQYLTSFNGLTFAKHYFFSSGMAQQYAFASPMIETFQVKREGATTWKSFPRRKKEFKAVALRYFGHIPYLKEKISDGSIGFDDVLTLIKSAEYFEKLKNDEMLYFDQYWNETTDPDGASYQAKIRSLEQDSLWTIDYFRNGQPLYRATYHALFPHKRHGTFEVLNEKGIPMRETGYDENKWVSTRQYDADGQLLYDMSFKEYTTTENTFTRVRYHQVLDANGNNLKKKEAWTETVSWTQGDFTNTYQGETLKQSYREKDGTKIYQWTDPNYRIKQKKLQTALNYYFEDKTFTKTVEDHAEGLYLVAIELSPKGKILNYTLYNPVHPELDEMMTAWAKRHLVGPYATKLKPYKVEDKKVHSELIIPIQFSINKFYRRPSSYYHDWGFQHMMFQQQMMMQPVNISPPPGF